MSTIGCAKSMTYVNQVIKYSNGDYWYCYQFRGPDITMAWTFNKESDAQNIIDINELADCTVCPVELRFTGCR